MEKKRCKYTVPRGTYQKIAEALGYSKGYVMNVNLGRNKNVKIEYLLALAHREHHAKMERTRRLKALVKELRMKQQ